MYLIIYFIAAKQLGNWVNAAACNAIGVNPTCGPGNQLQTRTCVDGTTDKCTANDRSRTISCSAAGTALPDCPTGIV